MDASTDNLVGELSKHDDFCWNCHLFRTQLETINCSKCNRCFHLNCIRANQGQCEYCAEMEMARIHWQKKPFDLSLLDILIEKLRNKCNFKKFNRYLKSPSKLLVHYIDLNDVKGKLIQKRYAIPEEVLTDIKWIRHNISILFNEKNWRKHADDLVYMCETELDSIRNCVDCYVNSSKFIKNGFTKICRQPHLLVWMEYKKYAYWPAKVMSIRDQKINLHFFGDYSTISTIADKCFLCSEQTPSIRPPKSLQYKRAIEELNAHIAEIRREYGSFCFANKGQRLDLNALDAHLFEMIPRLQIRMIPPCRVNLDRLPQIENQHDEQFFPPPPSESDAMDHNDSFDSLSVNISIDHSIQNVNSTKTPKRRNENIMDPARRKIRVPDSQTNAVDLLDELVNKMNSSTDHNDCFDSLSANISIDHSIQNVNSTKTPKRRNENIMDPARRKICVSDYQTNAVDLLDELVRMNSSTPRSDTMNRTGFLSPQSKIPRSVTVRPSSQLGRPSSRVDLLKETIDAYKKTMETKLIALKLENGEIRKGREVYKKKLSRLTKSRK